MRDGAFELEQVQQEAQVLDDEEVGLGAQRRVGEDLQRAREAARHALEGMDVQVVQDRGPAQQPELHQWQVPALPDPWQAARAAVAT